MEKKNYVQHSEDKEIEEFARLVIIKACGDPQNLMQPGAFEDLFDGGGLSKLEIGYDVTMDAGDEAIGYDPQSHTIAVSNKVYERLQTPDEEIKLGLAGAIGEALVTHPISGIAIPGILKAHLQLGRDTFAAFGRLRFAKAFVVPLSLLRKCRHDGMSPAKIRKYFDVTDDLINERLAML